MNTEDKIAKLAEDLDEWFEEGRSTLAVPDRFAQGRAMDRGVAIVRKLEQLKAGAQKTLKSSIVNGVSAPDQERVASLIKAFNVGAKLAAALHDELLDTDGANKIVLLMNDIAAALDATSQGRSALAQLLDNADSRIRASAGAYLLIRNLMPERVVPVLRAIDQRNEGRSADFTAHRALLDWELRQKAASINNDT
jgi:hypothetical protein